MILNWTVNMRYFRIVLITVMLVVVSMSLASADWAAGVAKSEQSIAGAERGGLALSLSAEFTSYSFGAPVTVNIELRNRSGRLRVVQTPQVATSYSFIVVDLTTGKTLRPRVPPRSGTDVYSGFNLHVAAGQSVFVAFTLNDMVYLERPGTYRVTVSTQNLTDLEAMRDVGLTSNPIVIRVVSR